MANMIVVQGMRPDQVYRTGVIQPAMRMDPLANARAVTNTFLPQTSATMAQHLIPADAAIMATLPAGGVQAAMSAAAACAAGKSTTIVDRNSKTKATVSPLGVSGTGPAAAIAMFAHRIAERFRLWFARFRGGAAAVTPVQSLPVQSLPAQPSLPTPINTGIVPPSYDNKAAVAAQILPATSGPASGGMRTAVEPYGPAPTNTGIVPPSYVEPPPAPPVLLATTLRQNPADVGVVPPTIVASPTAFIAPPPPPRIAAPAPVPPPVIVPAVVKTPGSKITPIKAVEF